MRSPWELLHQQLRRRISSYQASLDFSRICCRQGPLGAISDMVQLLDYFRTPGDLGEKDQLLWALVDEAQAGNPESRLAMDLIWLILWPGLDGVFQRCCYRNWKVSDNRIISAMGYRVEEQIQSADKPRIKKLIGTFVRNVERDINKSFFTDKSAQKTQLLEEWLARPGFEPLGDSGDVDDPEVLFYMLEAWFREQVPKDAELLVLVLKGHSYQEVADRLGIQRETARKRYWRSISKLTKVKDTFIS
jgi:hypothetical protein